MAENKTITLGDFIKEASEYQYSKQHFDDLKEAAEINLLATYIESYEYCKECIENDIMVTESVAAMFTEATDEEKDDDKKDDKGTKALVKVDDKKAGEVKEKFLTKVWNGIMKILKWLATPFTALAKLVERITNKLKYKGLSKEEIAAKVKGAKSNDKINELIAKFKEESPDTYDSVICGGFESNAKNDPRVKKSKSLGADKFVGELFGYCASPMIKVPATIKIFKEFPEGFVVNFKRLFEGFNSQDGRHTISTVKEFSKFVDSFNKTLETMDEKKDVIIHINDENFKRLKDTLVELRVDNTKAIDSLEKVFKDNELNVEGYNSLNELFQNLNKMKSLLYKIETPLMEAIYKKENGIKLAEKWADEISKVLAE